MPDVSVHHKYKERLRSLMAKPLRFSNPNQLAESIDGYFDFCANGVRRERDKRTGEVVVRPHSRPPTISGLALWLGFCNEAGLKTYLAHDDFFEVMESAFLRIKMWYEEMALTEKVCQGPLNLLKMRFGMMEESEARRLELKAVEVAQKDEHFKKKLAFETEVLQKRADLVDAKKALVDAHTGKVVDRNQGGVGTTNVNVQVNNVQPGLPGFPPTPDTLEEWEENYKRTHGIEDKQEEIVDAVVEELPPAVEATESHGEVPLT